MVIRETVVLTPAQLREDIEHPENVRVKLDDGVLVEPFDIGSLAYSKRRYESSAWTDAISATPVDLKSFRRERIDMLFSIFDHLSNSKFKDTTRLNKWRGFKKVIGACDNNGFSDFMESSLKCRKAYKGLSAEWINKARLNQISHNVASNLQSDFKSLIELCFSKNDTAFILERVARIAFKRNKSKPPREAHFQSYIKIAIAIAKQFRTFVVEEKNFPVKLKMPDYQAFVFQSQGGNVQTPFTSKHHGIYNFEEGRLSTFDEWKGTVKEGQQYQYDKSVNNFNEVNTNKRHERRIDFATLSMQAYMKLFVLLTGAQPTEVIQLEYSDKFEYEKDNLKNDFRAVKFRARGKVVSYSLGDRYGLALFQEYLQLREWILNGLHCKYLFFSVATSSDEADQLKVRQLKIGRGFYRYYHRIRGVYVANDFGDISSCSTRKYKNLILSELKISLETRASLLNHTQETNRSDYTETTPDRQAAEFQAHWEAVKQARKHIDLTGIHNKKTTVGHCTEEGKPESEIENPPIEPNCKTQYGCLFCSKYSCHADGEDVHKLYSVLGVIDIVRNGSTEFNHAEKIFRTLSIRINEILEAVSEKPAEHKSMVERTKKKVMELGLMTPFWERRLDQYERMGVIILG